MKSLIGALLLSAVLSCVVLVALFSRILEHSFSRGKRRSDLSLVTQASDGLQQKPNLRNSKDFESTPMRSKALQPLISCTKHSTELSSITKIVRSFAILHEITAIIPLPIVFYVIHSLDLSIPFPEDILQEANKKMKKMLVYFGINVDFAEDSKVMIELATTYAVVKALMPVRIGLSFLLTPAFARYLNFILIIF